MKNLNLPSVLATQKAAFQEHGAPSYDQRMCDLDKLKGLVVDNWEEVVEAISADFGNRSRHESLIAEIFTTVSAINHIQSHLKKWMQPQKRHVSLLFKPGTADVRVQPLGVVGIIAPWNYPFFLAMVPLATALAAGNRAMIKPSEITPATSACMERLLAQGFENNQVAVALGGAEVGAEFSTLAFDHLFFTGSTAVGRKVMEAASRNLTPVTLELGGKSPALVAPDFPLSKAADCLAAGKTFNAGQTCVAPDYALVPADRVEELADLVEHQIAKFYPTLENNPDYTSIVNDRHYDRLMGLIADARKKGGHVVSVNPAGENLDAAGKKIAPTIIKNPTMDMGVMTEEIFGPILPIVGYESLDEAVRFINERPRPLALYYFDKDPKRVEWLLANTTSGGVCVNDVMLQVAQDDLPFGGVGDSGMGAYHGKEGFFAFSHKKGVFHQTMINPQGFLRPPFSHTLERLIRLLVRK